MWCSTCLADLALDQFSNSQKKRSASARKCSACATAAASADGGGAPPVPLPREASTAAATSAVVAPANEHGGSSRTETGTDDVKHQECACVATDTRSSRGLLLKEVSRQGAASTGTGTYVAASVRGAVHSW